MHTNRMRLVRTGRLIGGSRSVKPSHTDGDANLLAEAQARIATKAQSSIGLALCIATEAAPGTATPSRDSNRRRGWRVSPSELSQSPSERVADFRH